MRENCTYGSARVCASNGTFYLLALQEVLDDLMPNLIPLLYTLLMYYLIDKKKVNIILLMVATICLGCLGVVVGIL